MLYAFQPNSVGEQQENSYPAHSEDGVSYAFSYTHVVVYV